MQVSEYAKLMSKITGEIGQGEMTFDVQATIKIQNRHLIKRICDDSLEYFPTSDGFYLTRDGGNAYTSDDTVRCHHLISNVKQTLIVTHVDWVQIRVTWNTRVDLAQPLSDTERNSSALTMIKHIGRIGEGGVWRGDELVHHLYGIHDDQALFTDAWVSLLMDTYNIMRLDDLELARSMIAKHSVNNPTLWVETVLGEYIIVKSSAYWNERWVFERGEHYDKLAPQYMWHVLGEILNEYKA